MKCKIKQGNQKYLIQSKVDYSHLILSSDVHHPITSCHLYCHIIIMFDRQDEYLIEEGYTSRQDCLQCRVHHAFHNCIQLFLIIIIIIIIIIITPTSGMWVNRLGFVLALTNVKISIAVI